MKIAIPSEGKNLESLVNQTFGRTETFIVVDNSDMSYKAIDNTAASAQGGAGIKAAQAIVDSGAEAIITFRCGQNAADVLKTAGIKIYKATAGSINDVVKMYNAGKLDELTDIHAGYHNHGGA
ncbi:MAG: NifB/NifX family molybdenum-iron cluster-binding protein [Lutispora sp.]|nr:NifB/NifX family molybdenum-iron cluster-binding protein [Lutispora sp.]